MEWLIRHGGTQEMELYNCSANYDSGYGRAGVPHPIAGSLALAYGIIIELMYIPCMLVICSREFISLSCFKIMCLLGITDMLAIMVNSIFTGIFLLEGAEFCTHPDLIYVTGAIGLGLWCMACLICLLLVVNRLIDMWRPDIGHWLFDGWRLVVLLSLPVVYGACFTLFTPPVLFTSTYMAWFFDPAIYAGRTMEYQNPPHSTNNFFIVGFTALLYVFFTVTLGKKLKTELTTGSAGSRAHKQIFIQSSVICFVNMGASVIYVIMQFFPVPPFIIVAGHIGWQFGHGCPAVIYLCMNRTIRNGVLKMFGFKKDRFVSMVSTNSHHVVSSKS